MLVCFWLDFYFFDLGKFDCVIKNVYNVNIGKRKWEKVFRFFLGRFIWEFFL